MIVIGGTELVNCDLFHICFAQVEGDEKEELLTGTSYLVSTKEMLCSHSWTSEDVIIESDLDAP